MPLNRFLSLSLCAILLWSARVEGQELPTSLACTANAKAQRDFSFSVNRWEGGVPTATTFGIHTRGREVPSVSYPLRDKVFSGLHTGNPLVRSITRYVDGVEQGVEFPSTVLSQFDGTVFLLWMNPSGNKVWTAAVDRKHRRATVTQVFQGVTSVGGEFETLDCR